MNSSRLFTAIIPPDEILDDIMNFSDSLRKYSWYKKVKWVKRRNLHITLKFIGEVENQNIEKIIKHTEEAVSEIKPFDVNLNGCLLFPNKYRPRVIGIGIYSSVLKDLAFNVDNSLKEIGIKKEKRSFKGHITIGRFRKSLKHGIKLEESILKKNFHVKEVLLVESVLKQEGAEYKILKKVELN